VTAAPSATARAYAKALFALAKERGEAPAVGREVTTLVETLRDQPELRAVLARPWIAAPAKRAMAAAVAQRLAVSALARDFFALVAARGRTQVLEAIAGAYQHLLDADAGRARARVRTAVPLTENERRVLAAKIGRALGGKDIVLEEVIDPELIAGFVAEIGSFVLDGSVTGQLARMRERLARG
jgi:F-type H+-transporting ATPase subunit delta